MFDLEIDLMKERFAKLLLGEDMSGGGKGVSTALAISNAITNLSGWCNYIFPLNTKSNFIKDCTSDFVLKLGFLV